jgi:peptide/nickel transport system ATP-binding protein
VIALRGISAAYGHEHVLHDVDLELTPEGCVAVVGETGSGKTTLARCIVGLHDRWTGDMRFGNERLEPGIRKRPKEVLRRIQYVFQNPYMSLNPRKRVGRILSQPLEHYFGMDASQSKDRVVQALRDVSLSEEFRERYPGELSGGERQRVAIARALVAEPDVLVCDEITSALDVSVQAVIIELLRRLQLEQHLSMIFITHNLSLVRSIAQTAVVLWDGRVVEHGPVGQILDAPKAAYTIGLIEAAPRIAGVGGASAVRTGHSG